MSLIFSLQQEVSKNLDTPQTSSWLCLGVGAAAGTLAFFHPASDYVAHNSPRWFVLAGVAVAVIARLSARTMGQRHAGLLIATVLLLPSACTLLLLHVLRAVGAIPFPVDLISASVSIGAAIVLLSLWILPNPLRTPRDLRVPVPRWVPVVGIAASLVYPTLKTLWAFGIDVAAPPDTVGVVDATFYATVAVSLAAVPALLIAMRWWDRPAPRWMRPTALVGGLVLLSLGVSGLWGVAQSPAEDPATGLLVYGGWLIWGVATLATAGQLSPENDARS
ncbi:hypothetical protein [Brevibacterium luteolum]|uniref:Uncharacterized protein n=1 Tax=Brevibacterium luteolum TaxID=199591 RepID=A0A6G8KU97_9MICO|nr:hypothetical protein [Brevibacterium luteolum]QIN28348.1 hypothetical protein EW640_02960 [Brevibacterium luteolum]